MQVSVVHCSAGIEYIPAQSVVMDPAEVTNLTFVLYSFHSISQVNHCEGVCVFTYICCVHGHYPFNRHLLYIHTVHIRIRTYIYICIRMGCHCYTVQLYDEKGVLRDNQSVSFTTYDTCFCHGFCGCSVSSHQFAEPLCT